MTGQPRELAVDHYNMLKEVASRGAAQAAGGLSEMVGRSLGIDTVGVSMLRIAEVPTLLQNPEDPVVGVYLSFEGEVKGHIVLLFSPREASGLADMVLGLPAGATQTLGLMERSALGEVGNLTGSFFLMALADLTNLASKLSPPAVLMDMGAAVLDVPLVELAQSADEAMVMNTLFTDQEHRIEALFLVMPDAQSLQKILDRLTQRWPRE